MIKPVNQDWMKYRLTIVNPMKEFTVEPLFPDMKIVVHLVHTVENLTSGKTKITHTILIESWGSDQFASNIDPSMVLGIPETMENMVCMAKAEKSVH
jgi:hypothetical protein